MASREIVVEDGEILDLTTLTPIKSSPKNVALQKVLRHLSMSFGIPISRFEIGWRERSGKILLKSDIVIYDSSDDSRQLIGLVHCGKLPSLSEKSTITSSQDVANINKALDELMAIS